MSKYFSYFPTVEHDLTNNGQLVELTNILRRFAIRSSVKDNVDVFYEYDIQAGDRPDTIAEKYYGSANYAWIVLHYNDITDPIFGWALFGADFDNYIKGKYGSLSAAQAEVHEYRWITQTQSTKYDGTVVPKKYVVVDSTTYATLAASERETVSKYDWEIEKNDTKRKIKILDKRYFQQIVDEVEDVLRNGI